MTTFYSDLSKSYDQILIDLINHDNGTQYQVGDFMYGLPQVSSGVVFNTKLQLTGVQPGRTYGETEVEYNRVNFATLPGIERLSAYAKDTARTSDIIPIINATLGVNLTEGGYVDEELPSFAGMPQGSKVGYIFKITEDNLVYTGSVELILYV